jgi:hypothetical protein
MLELLAFIDRLDLQHLCARDPQYDLAALVEVDEPTLRPVPIGLDFPL